MSWHGSHPRYSKKVITAILPPAACRHCVYWFRTVAGSAPDSWAQQYQLCPRCGMALWDVLATVNERLVGISTPHQPRMQEPLAPACATPQGNSGNSGLDKWLKLYGSLNFEIRLRAARALLERPDIPLTILLEIFDQLSQHGLGGRAELALLQRRDPELANAMIARLVSPDPITRAVVCGILGRCNNTAATPHLLRMVEDPYIGVRSAAGWALSDLRDVSAIPELKRLFAAHKDDDINVVLALRGALKSLGVDMGTI